HSKDPADPRAGEWTALRIVQGIAEEITDPGTSHSRDRVSEVLIPENVAIPERWTNLTRESLTWGHWRTEVDSGGFQFCTSDAAIRDRRIIAFSEYGDEDFNWQTVRALGLVLLGLLRRSFSWPAPWNAGSSALSWSIQARRMIGM